MALSGIVTAGYSFNVKTGVRLLFDEKHIPSTVWLNPQANEQTIKSQAAEKFQHRALSHTWRGE
jgi:hypothetical protein